MVFQLEDLQLGARCSLNLSSYPLLDIGKQGCHLPWWWHFEGIVARSWRKTVLFLTFKLTRDILKNLHLKRKETLFTNEKFSKVNALRKRKGTSVVRASGFCKSPSEKEVRGLEAETGLSKGLPSWGRCGCHLCQIYVVYYAHLECILYKGRVLFCSPLLKKNKNNSGENSFCWLGLRQWYHLLLFMCYNI